MRSLLVSALFLVLAGQNAMAATSQEVVRDYERAHSVTCRYLRSSNNQYCFNNICQFTKYYSCGETTLNIKVRVVRYPDGSGDEKVIDYSVGGF